MLLMRDWEIMSVKTGEFVLVMSFEVFHGLYLLILMYVFSFLYAFYFIFQYIFIIYYCHSVFVL